MYELIQNLLSDKETGNFTFAPFSLCHIIYLLIISFIIFITIVLYRKRSKEEKIKLINFTLILAVIVYIADFFLMPFSEGEISLDKLPFHICTLMSIMSLLSRKTKFFARFKTSFTLMGMIGATLYLVYPAGVNEADGYSYRIIQTVLYHGLMIAYGVFSIAFSDLNLGRKTIKYDLVAITSLALLAFVANHLYSGVIEEVCGCKEGCLEVIKVYDFDFNWFFVKHDPLYIIPDEIDVFFAPFLMIFVIFFMCFFTRILGRKILKKTSKKQALN